MKKRGQGMVSGLVGLMVALIILVAVVIPVVKDTISNQSFTGTTKTIGDLFPLMLIVGGFILVVGIFTSRR